MSGSTITNFIEPTKEIIAWVKSQLEIYMGWNVYRYDKINKDELFMYILELETPCAIVIYTGSTYDDENERRRGSFSVIVADKDSTDTESATNDAQDLLDKVISLLDHEIYKDAFFRVVSDKPIDFKNSGMVAYEIGFIFDDH